MTFRAIFYDQEGRVSPAARVIAGADPEHLPDIIVMVPGRITYDHDGHDPAGRHIYRERGSTAVPGSPPKESVDESPRLSEQKEQRRIPHLV